MRVYSDNFERFLQKKCFLFLFAIFQTEFFHLIMFFALTFVSKFLCRQMGLKKNHYLYYFLSPQFWMPKIKLTRIKVEFKNWDDLFSIGEYAFGYHVSSGFPRSSFPFHFRVPNYKTVTRKKRCILVKFPLSNVMLFLDIRITYRCHFHWAGSRWGRWTQTIA